MLTFCGATKAMQVGKMRWSDYPSLVQNAGIVMSLWAEVSYFLPGDADAAGPE